LTEKESQLRRIIWKRTPAKKPKAVAGVGRPLAEKIIGQIYEMESEDEEL
jgi:hypothetical protein